MTEIRDRLFLLAENYASVLNQKIVGRIEEMGQDDKTHYLIYQVLGIGQEEGQLIDLYQNKGRFLYKYAGAFLEEATFLCFKEKFPHAQKIQIPNTLGRRPKQFEIDCLIDINAIEIKWRDATTDGDHITKEHTRIQVIKEHGYKPIRLMFFEPNREQAQKIQATLQTIYTGVGGEYYSGEPAWQFVYKETEINLKNILQEIAQHMSEKGGK
jgi:hypothetical protein